MAKAPLYVTVAEDIEWFARDWWSAPLDGLDDAQIRRGSTTLRLLLVDSLVLKAWKHYGYSQQPKLPAPDVHAWTDSKGLELKHAVGFIAGGGHAGGFDMAMIGLFRVRHPETGVAPDANVGFALRQTLVSRIATPTAGPSDLDAMIDKMWRLTDYLYEPAAVHQGVVIKRRDIIQYFANFAGGAHLNGTGTSRRKKTATYERIGKLAGFIRAHVKDGLFFELLSIGQAVGRSPDLLQLASTIRSTVQASRG